MSIVYLNGQYIPIEQAQISVLDRGFLFGDAIYEVIPVFNNKIFRLPQHLKRLRASLDAIKLTLAYDDVQWRNILNNLIQHNPDCQSIYLQISRGAQAQRQHHFSSSTQPTLFMMCNPATNIAKSDAIKGVKAITLPDIRWQRCDIKTTSLIGNVLLKQQAQQADAEDAILIRDGMAIEAASSNLFIVQPNSDMIITPPVSQQILAGITRDLIIELCDLHHIPLLEQPISEQQLHQAQEIWLTSSSKGITPVIQLNEAQVGDGRIGKNWYNIQQKFLDYQASL